MTTYEYDDMGRRTTATAKNKLGTLLSRETYRYDLRSQLTGFAGPNSSKVFLTTKGEKWTWTNCLYSIRR